MKNFFVCFCLLFSNFCFSVDLDQIPAGMVGKMVPESTFALYRAAGDFPKSLIDTWGNIWHSNLKRTYEPIRKVT
jgi:predicted transcriptional regulator YdeE